MLSLDLNANYNNKCKTLHHAMDISEGRPGCWRVTEIKSSMKVGAETNISK
jgi:hypothetical protein